MKKDFKAIIDKFANFNWQYKNKAAHFRNVTKLADFYNYLYDVTNCNLFKPDALNAAYDNYWEAATEIPFDKSITNKQLNKLLKACFLEVRWNLSLIFNVDLSNIEC